MPRPVPLRFLGEHADQLSMPARWALHGVPVVLLAGVVAQRWSDAPPLPLLGVAALVLVPIVADLYGVGLPDAVMLLLDVVAVAVLIVVWTAPVDLAPFVLVLGAAIGGATHSTARSALGAGIAAAVPVGADLFAHFEGGVIWSVGVFAGWAAGTILRRQLSLVDRLAEAAAADERRRIAGELHDVVAHSLAVTMLHLTGARLALETDDRDEALAALLEAERIGRASLADIRRSVGLLGGDAVTEPALPVAAELPALVEEFRGAGLDVRLRVDGDLAAVPTAAGLAVYRIAQESLANVVRHAPGAAAHLAVAVEPTGVRVDVENEVGAEPSGSGSGFGLRGMRERAEALGGSCVAGPHGTRWRVEAVLPS